MSKWHSINVTGVANDMTTNTTIGESVADEQSTLTSEEKKTPDTNEKESLEQMLPGVPPTG